MKCSTKGAALRKEPHMILYRLTPQYSRRNIMEKSIHFTSFSKEIFSIYSEHNRNSIES